MYRKILRIVQDMTNGVVVFDPKSKRYWMCFYYDNTITRSLRRFICLRPTSDAGIIQNIDDSELLNFYYVGTINHIDESEEPQDYRVGDVIRFADIAAHMTPLPHCGGLGLICRTAEEEVHVIDLFDGSRYADPAIRVLAVTSPVISSEQLKKYLEYSTIPKEFKRVGQMKELIDWQHCLKPK